MNQQPQVVDMFGNPINTNFKFDPNAGKQRGKGGTLTSLISEGGAVGGGIAGAAIGSAVPVIGTAIGGIIGAGLGAFGGRLAENKVRDNRWGVGDAAKEGAVSAVLAGPLKLGKYGMAAGKAGLAGEGLAKALATGASAADQSIIKAGIGKAVGNKSLDVADNLAQRALKMNNSNFNTQFANRFGEEVGQFANRFNLVGKTASEAKDTLIKPASKVYEAGIKALGKVPKNEIMRSVQEEVADLAKSSLPEDRAFAKEIIAKARKLVGQYGNEITGEQLNKLKQDAYSKINTKLTDQAGQRSNNVYDTLSNAFRKAVNSASERVGVSVDPTALGGGFKATNLGDLGQELFALREFVPKMDVASRVGKGSQILGFNKLAASGAGATALGGPAGAIAAGTTATALNSPKVTGALARGAEAIGQRLTSTAGSSTVGTGARQAVRGVAGKSLVDALGGYSGNTSDATNSATMTNTAPNTVANIVPTSSANQGGMSTPASGSPYPLENLMADIQRDPKNMDKYLTMFDLLDKKFNPQGGKLNATQVQQANNAMSALNDIQSIRSTLATNPRATAMASLPGGSLVRSLTGTSGYDAARKNVADVIGRLRSGGAINADEQRNFLSMLPASFDSPAVAEQKLARLEELFMRFANPQPTQADFALQQ